MNGGTQSSVARMTPQLSEAWDENDDWTGIASPEERRRRQNRLHQRAYRKKRHLKRLAQNDELKSIIRVQRTTPRQTVSALPAPVKDLSLFYLLRCPEPRQMVIQFLQRAFADRALNVLRLGDLPAVSRLNAFDALARNALVLGIPVELLESDDGPSPFVLPQPRLPSSAGLESSPQTFPGQLAPTTLQRTVAHHPWLDLFPIPGMRDNILRGIQLGLLDEDQLCQGLVCELLDLDASSTASVMIWGDPWDISGWEFSPEFFRRWGFLLAGCPEVFQATNAWRAKRHELRIEFVLN